ncbi:hypothetical protein [Acetobacter fallax]|uniref:Uncharacterized protein n=1 Tax=Acetobacter fallax TaxID=1737473 RepID=A0ABX0KDF6_9PROT|nr:hypothetical protein [Acetobacter fallax]NHO33494.1 hypothetical protein [Acetobacter fallax]NHO37098.1 hypothetical protein [Acetobacter fallax]
MTGDSGNAGGNERTGCPPAHIDSPEGRHLWRTLQERMPHLGTLIRYLDQKQASPPESPLLWYQQELFERWFFRVPSPMTGRMIHSGEACLIGDRATAFRLPEAPQIVLISIADNDACPVNTVLETSTGASLHFGSRTVNLTSTETAAALNAFTGPPQTISRVVAICGTAPFRTQLPALQTITRLRRYTPEAAQIDVPHVPPGDILALVPDLRNRLIKEPDATGGQGQVMFRFGYP